MNGKTKRKDLTRKRVTETTTMAEVVAPPELTGFPFSASE